MKVDTKCPECKSKEIDWRMLGDVRNPTGFAYECFECENTWEKKE